MYMTGAFKNPLTGKWEMVTVLPLPSGLFPAIYEPDRFGGCWKTTSVAYPPAAIHQAWECLEVALVPDYLELPC